MLRNTNVIIAVKSSFYIQELKGHQLLVLAQEWTKQSCSFRKRSLQMAKRNIAAVEKGFYLSLLELSRYSK